MSGGRRSKRWSAQLSAGLPRADRAPPLARPQLRRDRRGDGPPLGHGQEPHLPRARGDARAAGGARHHGGVRGFSMAEGAREGASLPADESDGRLPRRRAGARQPPTSSTRTRACATSAPPRSSNNAACSACSTRPSTRPLKSASPLPEGFTRQLKARAQNDLSGVRDARERRRALKICAALGLAAFALLGYTAFDAVTGAGAARGGRGLGDAGRGRARLGRDGRGRGRRAEGGRGSPRLGLRAAGGAPAVFCSPPGSSCSCASSAVTTARRRATEKIFERPSPILGGQPASLAGGTGAGRLLHQGSASVPGRERRSHALELIDAEAT